MIQVHNPIEEFLVFKSPGGNPWLVDLLSFANIGGFTPCLNFCLGSSPDLRVTFFYSTFSVVNWNVVVTKWGRLFLKKIWGGRCSKLNSTSEDGIFLMLLQLKKFLGCPQYPPLVDQLQPMPTNLCPPTIKLSLNSSKQITLFFPPFLFVLAFAPFGTRERRRSPKE